MANVALFLSHVVGELALSLLTLKVYFCPPKGWEGAGRWGKRNLTFLQAISLTSLTPQQGRFLDLFFVYLFSQFEEKRIYEVFKRLVVVDDVEADRVSKDLTFFFSKMFRILLFVPVINHPLPISHSNLIIARYQRGYYCLQIDINITHRQKSCSKETSFSN